MRKVIIIVLCSMVLFLTSACSQNNLVDDVIFQQIDPLSIKDSNLQETIIGNLEEGVYGIQTELKYYILFNSIKNSYKDISCRASGNSLEILFSKERLPLAEKIVYEVDLPESIDTIILLQDGENIAFKSVIID